MNFSTFAVVAVLALIVVLDIRYLLKNGLDSCGGDCERCGSSCKWGHDIQKAQKHIKFQKKLKKIFRVQ